MSRIQKLGLIFTMITSAAVIGCDAPDEQALVPFQDRQFAPEKVSAEPIGAEHRLTFTGTVDGIPMELYLDLNLDQIASTMGATHNLGGETYFESVQFARFIPFAEHSNAVVRAYAMGTCDTCELDGSWQLVTGVVAIDHFTDTAIGGRLSIVLEGDIPLAGGLRNLRTTVSGPFEAPLTAAPIQPVIAESEPTPVPVAEPTPTQPEQVPAEGNLPQEETTSMDYTPQGPLATEASPVYEATLQVGWGLNLETGETLAKANFANSDLYATAGNPYLKLTPGGSSPTKGQPLRWFKNSGGFVKSFGALADVPLEIPTDNDGSQSIVSVKPYMGFIVKANLSDVYARVWVRTASASQISLEYQLITAIY